MTEDAADQSVPTSDAQSTEALTSADASADLATCVFPTGPEQFCGRPIPHSDKPGRKSSYCDLPDHTRSKAFIARREIALQAAGGNGPQGSAVTVVDQPDDAERPVSHGRATVGVLLAQFREDAASVAAQLAASHSRLAGTLDRAAGLAEQVMDPDAAAYEVEQVQREARIKVDAAESAQAAAEKAAVKARRDADSERELRAQADAAADEALAELEQVRATATADVEGIRAETAAEIERITTQARTEVNTAEDRAEEWREAAQAAVTAKETAERVAGEQVDAARTAAEQAVAKAKQDAETQVNAAKAAAEEEVRQIRADAAREITEVKQAAASAVGEANSQAEQDRLAKGVAEQAATDARERADRLDAELERRTGELTAERNVVQELRDKLDTQQTRHDEAMRDVLGKLDKAREDAATAVEKIRSESAAERARVDAQHAEQVTGYQRQVQQLQDQVRELTERLTALTTREQEQDRPAGKPRDEK